MYLGLLSGTIEDLIFKELQGKCDTSSGTVICNLIESFSKAIEENNKQLLDDIKNFDKFEF